MVSLWSPAALWFDVPVPWFRGPLVVVFGICLLAVWFGFRRRPWRAITITAGFFLVTLAWWLTLSPSNNRDWQPDLAVLPWAEIGGDHVTIHNIRNCDYRTETDFDVRHYDKTFALDQLRAVDMFLVHWGSPLIAHTMVSFGFATGDEVCFSIEVRKEKGEGYSAVRGFFRQYELIYIIADERDLVRLRTNYRQGEEVRLYRLKMRPERQRALFLEYLRRANQLREHPEWYNALTSNCTTGIRLNADNARGTRSPWDWRILANGCLDELLYERGALASDLPFAELQMKCHINSRGRAAGQSPDFSRQIRAGLPFPP